MKLETGLAVFLGLFGIAVSVLVECGEQESASDPDPAREAPPWSAEILALWRKALEIAWGWKGPWPLDGPRKFALLRELDGAIAQLSETPGPEAGLLLVELRRLRDHVEQIRIPQAAPPANRPARRDAPRMSQSRLLVRMPHLRALPGSVGKQGLAELLPFVLEDLTDLDIHRTVAWDAPESEELLEGTALLGGLRGSDHDGLEGDTRWAELRAACREAFPWQGGAPKAGARLEALDALDRRLEDAARLACRIFLDGKLELGECQLLVAEITRLRMGIDWQRRLLWCLPFQPHLLEGAPDPRERFRRLSWLPGFTLAEAKAGRLQEPVARLLLAGSSQGLALLRAGRWAFIDLSRVALDPIEQAIEGLAARFGLKIPSVANTPPARPGETLQENPAWKRILAVWSEAEEIAMGRRGDHPYTAQKMGRLLTRLEMAAAELADLAEAGPLSEGERGLLQDALAELGEKASSFRTEEYRDFTCYIGGRLHDGRPVFERIERRLPLLEKLVAEGKISGEVLARVLGGLTRDLDALAGLEPDSSWLRLKDRPPSSEAGRSRFERLDPEAWARGAARLGELVPALLPQTAEPRPALEGVSAWVGIARTLEQARGVVSGDGTALTSVERKLGEARLAASRMAVSGALAGPELRLVHAELEWHRQRLHRLRRFNPFAPRFLETDTYSQALASTRKLSWAVPFVVPLAREGRIRSAMLEALLPGLRAARDDLRDLADRDRNACARHPAFPGLEERATAAIQELERLLAAAPKPDPRNGR